MGNVTTTRTAAGVPARYQEKGVFVDVATYECSSLAANEVIQFINVAPGVTVLEMRLDFDDLGTGVTVDVGDGDDVDRFMDGVDVSTASGTARMGAGITVAPYTAFPKTYTTADTIDGKILGAAATGTITLTVFMTAEGVDLD